MRKITQTVYEHKGFTVRKSPRGGYVVMLSEGMLRTKTKDEAKAVIEMYLKG